MFVIVPACRTFLFFNVEKFSCAVILGPAILVQVFPQDFLTGCFRDAGAWREENGKGFGPAGSDKSNINGSVAAGLGFRNGSQIAR